MIVPVVVAVVLFEMRAASKRHELAACGNCVPTVISGADGVPVIFESRSCPACESQSSTRYSVSLVLSSVIAGAIVKPQPSSVCCEPLLRHVFAKSASNSLIEPSVFE